MFTKLYMRGKVFVSKRVVSRSVKSGQLEADVNGVVRAWASRRHDFWHCFGVKLTLCFARGVASGVEQQQVAQLARRVSAG